MPPHQSNMYSRKIFLCDTLTNTSPSLRLRKTVASKNNGTFFFRGLGTSQWFFIEMSLRNILLHGFVKFTIRKWQANPIQNLKKFPRLLISQWGWLCVEMVTEITIEVGNCKFRFVLVSNCCHVDGLKSTGTNISDILDLTCVWLTLQKWFHPLLQGTMWSRENYQYNCQKAIGSRRQIFTVL